MSYGKNFVFHFGHRMEENDSDSDIEDLLSYFEQQLTLECSFPKFCTPELEMTQMHISGTGLLFHYTITNCTVHLKPAISLVFCCSLAQRNPDVHISLGCVQ